MNETIKQQKKNIQGMAEPRAPDRVKTVQSAKSQGQFRTIAREAEARAAPFKGITPKNEGNETQQIRFRRLESSSLSEMALGENDKHQKVILGYMKKGSVPTLNTSTHKSVNMNRAKPLYGKDYTTYSDKEGSAFCQWIEVGDNVDHFLRYLTAAAKESETKGVKEVFPFLSSELDWQQYQAALDKKKMLSSLEESREQRLALEMTTETVERLREKLYSDQMKRVQFKKKLEQMLTNKANAPSDSEQDTFWLWQWILRLKHWIEEEMEVFTQQNENN